MQIDENTRLLRLIRCGLKPKELVDILRGIQAFQFARSLGVPTNGMTREGQAITAIYNHLPQIFENEGIGEPVWPNPHPVCPGYPDAEGLRWKKADRGEPVTFSIDYTGAQPIQKELLTAEIVAALFNEWALAPSSITFAPVTFNKRKKTYGDIHIGFAALPDRVMGSALMPRGAQFMEEGGMASGDIFLDNDRNWVDWELLLTTLHEIGHGCGLAHSRVRGDVMYESPSQAGARGLQSGDIQLIQGPYPPEK